MKQCRMIKMGSSFIAVVCLVFIFLAQGVIDAEAQSKTKKKAPDLIRVATYDVGSTGYVMYGFLQEAIAGKTGAKIRAIPIGSDLPRMMAIRNKMAEFCGQGTDTYFAAEGLDRYATRSWGPQPIRAVWLAESPGVPPITKGDSGIKKCADLKGKKIPWIPGSIFNQYHEAVLSFCGLTWNDVDKTQVSGFGAMTRALPEGKVDMIAAAITIPTAYELASSAAGIYFLPLPASNHKGWKNAQKINPLFHPYKAVYGPGNVSEKNPVECIGHPYPVTIAYDFLDDDTAYFMTKAINEVYPIIAAKSQIMKRFWGIDKCMSVFENSRGIPMHPGSIRYFKEIGVWKPGYNKLQDARIKRQQELVKLWNSTLAEAKAKGISDSEFPQFWTKKHEQTFREMPE